MVKVAWPLEVFGSKAEQLFGEKGDLWERINFDIKRKRQIKAKICEAVHEYLCRREIFGNSIRPSKRKRAHEGALNLSNSLINNLSSVDKIRQLVLDQTFDQLKDDIRFGSLFFKAYKEDAIRLKSEPNAEFLIEDIINKLSLLKNLIQPHPDLDLSPSIRDFALSDLREKLIQVYVEEYKAQQASKKVPEKLAKEPAAYNNRGEGGSYPKGSLVEYIKVVSLACSEEVEREIYGSDGRPIIEAWSKIKNEDNP